MNTFSPKTQVLLENIVKESSFTLGILRGKKSRAIFEPKRYKENQIALIKSIFDSNEYICKFSFYLNK